MSIGFERVHVVPGDPGDHGEYNFEGEPPESLYWWNISRDAQRGDLVVIYMMAPMKSFVATAIVDSDTWILDDPTSKWHGETCVDLRNFEPLPRLITRIEARDLFPKWSYLEHVKLASMPNKSTNSKQLEDFLNYLHAPTTSPAEPQHPRKLSVIEGVAREVRRMLSGRNKRIRDAAFKGANGVCEACGNDYSKVLAGSGTRVLHVHHKKQLSLQILPDETTLDDLAVVCANCHMLIHMDPQNAIPVEVLSGMLIEDQAPKYGTKAS